MMDNQKQQAATLLGMIWKGTPLDFKMKYRMSIWRQFEDNIRSAAYTNSLAKFLNSLCFKLNAEIGRNAEDRATVDEILRDADDGIHRRGGCGRRSALGQHGTSRHGEEQRNRERAGGKG